MSTEREFFQRRLARKQNELAAIEEDIDTCKDRKTQLKLDKDAQLCLKEITALEQKLQSLDYASPEPIVKVSSMQQTLRQIDFREAKSLASKLKGDLESECESKYAMLLLFQRFLNHKGDLCFYEMMRIILESDLETQLGSRGSDGYRNNGLKTYEVDLSDLAAEGFSDDLNFLQKLLKYEGEPDSGTVHELSQRFVRSLCKSMRSGDRVLFWVKEWHRGIEPEIFLKWFVEGFWKSLLQEINQTVLCDYGKIKVVAVLSSKKKLDFSLPENLVCQPDCFDTYRLIDVPLPLWEPRDVEAWLMEVKGFKRRESSREAQRICEDSDGLPATICSTLMEKYSV
jgi:hypothetical protein